VATTACAFVLLGAAAEAASVTIAWNPNSEPDIAGYTVYWGTNPGVYTSSQDVSAGVTSLAVSNLQNCVTYFFAVRAFNTAGLMSIYSSEVSARIDCDSPAPAALASISASTPSPIMPGTSVTFTATATGGVAPLQYRFWLYDFGTATWTLLRDYATANQATWTPAAAGVFTLQVWVRSSGSTASYDAYLDSASFEVGNPPLTVTSLTTPTAFPAAPTSQVTWTATTIGGTPPLEYMFWIYHYQVATWSVLQGYSTLDHVVWTPAAAGTYEVQVWVRQVGSGADYQAYGNSEDAVIADRPLMLSTVVAQPPLPVRVNTPVTFTATATAGLAPLQYKFWLYYYGTATWTLLQDYSSVNYVTWTPTRTGSYGLQVWVRAAGSTAEWEDWKGLGPFSVYRTSR
jgi:hypothetical protein